MAQIIKVFIALTLLVMIVGCGALPQSQTWDANYGTRINIRATEYISVVAGIVYDCTNTECIQLASFGEGLPLTVVGMIFTDSGWWYVVGVQRGLEGFIPVAVAEYDYGANTTPIAPNITNSI